MEEKVLEESIIRLKEWNIKTKFCVSRLIDLNGLMRPALVLN